MKNIFPNDLDLLCQKGFFPYEWVDSDVKLDYIGLPPMEEFYSALKQEHVSVENCQHAEHVYDKMNCKRK